MVCDATALGILGLGKVAAKIGWLKGTTTAAAGSAIGDANSLDEGKKIHYVTNDSNDQGVILPYAAHGEIILVKETTGTNRIKIYPCTTSDKFNGGTAAAAVTVAASACGIFIRISETDSIALELAAA